MKIGRTIVQEREKAESESERMQARKQAKKRETFSVIIVILLVVIVILSGTLIWGIVQPKDDQGQVKKEYLPTVEIIDQDKVGVTNRMKEYIGKVERDMHDLGYTVSKVVIPSGKTREVDVFLQDRKEFYKMNLDRGTAVSSEDAIRMLKYLDENKIKANYVDVRIEGKAYYKD